MNAVLAEQQRIRLELRSTREFPRRLYIELDPSLYYVRWTVSMYSPWRRNMQAYQLAYASSKGLRISIGERYVLWAGDVSFEVSADEARRIREAFENHGLIVEHIAPRQAATEQSLGAPAS